MKKLNQIWITEDAIYEKVYQDLIGDDPKTVGYCDDKTKHLYIKLGQDKQEEMDTFIHEILHAIQYNYKIKIKHTELEKLATALTKFLLLNNLVNLRSRK